MLFRPKYGQWRPVVQGVCWLALIILPSLVTLGMIQTYYGGQKDCMLPAFNDEVSHWHQIKTFAEAGFHGGYYTWNERTAKFPFVRFGHWGAGFPILFGSMAKVFGWEWRSALYYW